jgi:hypothetical protein
MREKLELILLPPQEKKEVSEQDIAKAYIDIMNLLLNNG